MSGNDNGDGDGDGNGNGNGDGDGNDSLDDEVVLAVGVMLGIVVLALVMFCGCWVKSRRRKAQAIDRALKLRDLDRRIAEDRKNEAGPVSGKWNSPNSNSTGNGADSRKEVDDEQLVSAEQGDAFTYDMSPLGSGSNGNDNDSDSNQHSLSASARSASRKGPPPSVPSHVAREVGRSRPMSVRDYVATNPSIPVVKPSAKSAKALKMLGVSEEETQYKYAGDVNARMKSVATGAGGSGMYTVGLATASLGDDVIKGFESRRQKLDRQREEREAAKKKKEEKAARMSQKKSSKVSVSDSGDDKKSNKPPPPTQPKMQPGTSKFKAFLGSQPPTSESEDNAKEQSASADVKPMNAGDPSKLHEFLGSTTSSSSSPADPAPAPASPSSPPAQGDAKSETGSATGESAVGGDKDDASYDDGSGAGGSSGVARGSPEKMKAFLNQSE